MMDEIMKALKRMKVGKAIGYDRVLSEMPRCGGGIAPPKEAYVLAIILFPTEGCRPLCITSKSPRLCIVNKYTGGPISLHLPSEFPLINPSPLHQPLSFLQPLISYCDSIFLLKKVVNALVTPPESCVSMGTSDHLYNLLVRTFVYPSIML
ncbi:hypothetical protein EVAR_11327_1 [Eumeta japonica]|uniref:Uncharacterized protein n=1 Tax=Eumeta variegata TaxID=151549 RepID=A0A4C1U168_EUMVA|nr:hypothetical protein EVAR_11327_1 [Eumeta japonica]